MPRVSVITAAYNHAKFVRESVQSVRSQTFRDFEHIVIDDGSTDGTAEILESFGTDIKYVRQENQGAHAAINRAVRMSSGEFIAIIDSDDAWLPARLEMGVRALDEAPEAGMVYSRAYFVDEKGARRDDSWLMGTPFEDPEQVFEELLVVNRIPILTVLIRKKCLDDSGLFSEDFKALSDWDLWLRVSTRWPVIFVPEILALYRVHETNSWHELLRNGRVARERLLLLKRARAAIKNTGFGTQERLQKIKEAFGNIVLYTTYEQLLARKYARALNFLAFACRQRPTCGADVWLAARRHPTFLKERKLFRVAPKAVLGDKVFQTWQAKRHKAE